MTQEQGMGRDVAVRLYEAVELRHSVRSYTGEKLTAAEREKLSAFVTDGWEPLTSTAHVRAVLIEGVEKTNRIFKGFIGGYGAVKNAPAMLVVIASIDQPHFYEAAGYMGEQCVLYATALGLDSCWVGGLYRSEEAAKEVALAPDERILAVVALGHAKQGGMTGLYEGLFKIGSFKRGKRRTIEEITYLEDVEPPPWFFRAMEAVQVGPSSYNKQPWHFFYHRDGRVSISSTVEYKEKEQLFPGAPDASRLCCGIAMAHFRVVTRALGVEGRWIAEEPEGMPIASFYGPQIEDDLDNL